MSMESLGGSMPAGRPAVVFLNGLTHVFAIGPNGVILHWSSANGLDWAAPDKANRTPSAVQDSR